MNDIKKRALAAHISLQAGYELQREADQLRLRQAVFDRLVRINAVDHDQEWSPAGTITTTDQPHALVAIQVGDYVFASDALGHHPLHLVQHCGVCQALVARSFGTLSDLGAIIAQSEEQRVYCQEHDPGYVPPNPICPLLAIVTEYVEEPCRGPRCAIWANNQIGCGLCGGPFETGL